MLGNKREWLLLLLLAAAPLVAYAPAWHEGGLLAPAAGAALHLPLRVEVFRAWRSGEVPSWNGAIFSGTPLLASYRPGALHPLMLALAPLPPFTAFQALVLVSLGLTGPLAYLYARRLGAGAGGALTTALGFALGPYLVTHLGDTATIVAAPALPLLLLAFENTLVGSGAAPGRIAWLAAASALVLLSGSWDAVRAAALLLGARLLLAFLPKLARGQPLDRARPLSPLPRRCPAWRASSSATSPTRRRRSSRSRRFRCCAACRPCARPPRWWCWCCCSSACAAERTCEVRCRWRSTSRSPCSPASRSRSSGGRAASR